MAKCVWKPIIERDASRARESNPVIYIRRKNPAYETCLKCTGSNEKCKKYEAVELYKNNMALAH